MCQMMALRQAEIGGKPVSSETSLSEIDHVANEFAITDVDVV